MTDDAVFARGISSNASIHTLGCDPNDYFHPLSAQRHSQCFYIKFVFTIFMDRRIRIWTDFYIFPADSGLVCIYTNFNGLWSWTDWIVSDSSEMVGPIPWFEELYFYDISYRDIDSIFGADDLAVDVIESSSHRISAEIFFTSKLLQHRINRQCQRRMMDMKWRQRRNIQRDWCWISDSIPFSVYLGSFLNHCR